MSTHHPSFASSSLGSVFKSLTRTLKPRTKNVPVFINPTVVGGGQDMQQLFRDLQSSSDIIRINAATQLSESLRQFPISSIPEVWYLVRDMCDGKNAAKHRKIGLNLLVQCIEHNDESVGTRMMFFKDIQRYCGPNDPEFPQFVLALSKLTNGGREIHEFLLEDTTLWDFLEEHMGKAECAIELVEGCFRYNLPLVEDSFVRSMLRRMIDDQGEAALRLVNIVATNQRVPQDICAAVVRHLSSSYVLHSDEAVKQLVISSVVSLDVQDVLSTLCDQLEDLKHYRHESSHIGAIHLLSHVIVHACAQGNLDVDCTYSRVFKTCKSCAEMNIPMVSTALLRSFDKLLLKSEYETNFGVVWTKPFGAILPYHTWVTARNTSVYDVLYAIRIGSGQDASYLQSICSSLVGLYEERELESPKDKLIAFLEHCHRYLSDDNMVFVLDYYRDENLCTMMTPNWRDNCNMILASFFHEECSETVRLHCLQVIQKAYVLSAAVFPKHTLKFEVIFDVVRQSVSESDPVLVAFVIDKLFSFVALTAVESVFAQLCTIIREAFVVAKPVGVFSLTSIHSSEVDQKQQMSGEFVRHLAEAMVELFATLAQKDGSKASLCYSLILDMFSNALRSKNIHVLLVLSKCLVRVRVTAQDQVYFGDPDEMVALSTLFKRCVHDESFVPGDYRWVYPEKLPYLPERLLDKPSRVLYLGKKETVGRFEEHTTPQTIDISPWLDHVTTVITEFVDWDIYSFVWAHMCSQLSNLRLFSHCHEQIIRLKDVICQQLTLQLPSAISLPSTFTKADLQVAFVRSLSSFIGYHHNFTKPDEDQIVSAVIYGLDSWEKTAVPCVNILTVCCYEMPLSIKKYLTVILAKLQVRMSGVFICTHILEFLMALVYLPSLTSNFTIEEFRRVLAVAFKYIQHAKDMRHRKQLVKVDIVQKHGVEAKVEVLPSNQRLGDEITPVLADYILWQSYRVITSWFLKIALHDRKTLSAYIIKNLLLCDSPELLPDQSLDQSTYAFIDFIIRYTFSDYPLTIVHTQKSLDFSHAENHSVCHYMIGHTIISMKTNTLNGDCRIIVRRPTGTSKFSMRADQARAVAHTNQPSHESVVSVSNDMITSNYFMLQFFNNMDQKSKPLPIADDPALVRAIAVLDRIPTVDFHKVGILYIGPGQSKEEEILLNRVGSKSYHELLDNIGQMVKLKGANNAIHVGGLDTENGMDGEHSIYWRDKTTQVMFHVPTMMHSDATAHMNDRTRSDLKKRHIGNNYVNIFFDESGLPFDFNAIKSQFNFLIIVVSPHTKGDKDEPSFFKVKTYRREGVPGVLATSHFKLVSKESLAVFIRNLCITASQFANVWHASGGYKGHWTQRAIHIESLREKARGVEEEGLGGLEGVYSMVEFNSYV